MENDIVKSKRHDIQDRTLAFAIRILHLCNQLPKTPIGYALTNQVIRSGTSIGANVSEAQDAISKKEFIKTMNISLKESRETLYWLTLTQQSKSFVLSEQELSGCIHECEELRRILASIVKNSRTNL